VGHLRAAKELLWPARQMQYNRRCWRVAAWLYNAETKSPNHGSGEGKARVQFRTAPTS